ncbi:hypothetical protein LJR098_003333 [Rhizobium sp. LjRoot98]|uniref:hypothetical protein n=1 Tax=Rhizobium sp. LjRoot98 TaxID=3342345 RepID=UPI003ECEE169
MKPKENIVINDENKDLKDFLVKLCAARSLSVDLDGETFVVEIRRERVSGAGREFLTKGGPDTD